jgi:colanic acid/amylovoran biosynthesis glycosyltransferase
MPRVLIFKETLLPPSETFILAQMQALRRFDPVLAGLERTRPSIGLPEKPVLLSDQAPLISNIRAKLYRRTGVAPVFQRAVRRLRPHLIHAHFASGGRSALPLARALGVPLVVTLHGSDVTVRGSQREIYRHLGEYASKFVCVSKFIRERALDAGFPAEKLCVHHIGINRSLFSPSEKAGLSNSVLFVGRLVEKKGCEYLLRAMQKVQQEQPECELIIIGDGPLRTSLEGLAQELGVCCNFRGTQPATAVREALSSARVFCVPSVTAANGDSEGLPTVLAEAQAMGIPVVSTTHGGIPEIIVNGVNGLLVPERDAGSLAAALVLLLSDEQRWRQFHRAALHNVEQYFDLQTQTAQLESIYSETIGEDVTVAAD